ncbi:uncharacterized protein EV422DRAFT_200028 [Fimicolochytrium jonesii]|uniref:uncharacterized protein n=1 Tax=Fimicolochytrium jonesii TaxID=1396493 RepID=UPI0022FDDC4C|nr:uncharacterized protein EV422DRAFT_200028 [Fimicolochytrium jonesii]KAI8817960.1 hypothetical protein EV422DRAFT_200028 [Fimicolochytrium jonesii]
MYIFPRNLHILDTPGFGMHPNAQLTITKVLSHQRAHFTRLDADFTRGLRAGTLASYVCNPTAPKNYLRPTDTFIYTLLHRIKPVDVAYIRALTDVGTVVLVLVKCDGLGPQRVREMKREVLEVVKKEKLRVELFGLDVDGALAILQGDGGGGDARVVVSPFAVTFKGDAGWGGAAKESVKVEGENKGEVDETRELTTALFVHAGEMRQGTAMKFAEWREHISKEERDGESRRRDGAPSDSSQVIQPDDTAEIPPSTSHNAAPRDDALTATEVLWLVAAFSLLAASFVFVSAGAFCAKGSRVAAAASHCGDRAAARAATRAATEGASAAGMLWAQWRGF